MRALFSLAFALTLASPLSGCALFKLAATGASHPEVSGSLRVPGLSDSVVIHRDGLGVPHIRGATFQDAVMGLGFVHAQDRLFQADLTRRIAYGDVSEWLGDRAVPLDHTMRGFGLRARAQVLLDELDEETVSLLAAYSAGVNAGAASLPTLPIEYRLLKQDFRPWTPLDVLANPYLLSYNLAENLPSEALALILRDRLDAAMAEDLFRLSGEGAPTEADWDRVRQLDVAPFHDGFKAFTDTLGGLPQMSEASNAWAVGPSHSADGSPIVANDPHLGQAVPSLWYAADLKGGDTHVAGVTLAGVPFVIIGHTDRVAWGITNVATDAIDLAVLKKTADDTVVVNGTPETLRTVNTTVGDSTSVTHWSSVGPLVSTLDADHVVAMRWDALSLRDHVVENFLQLNRAQSVQDALDAFEGKPMSIAQNLVVGDVEGDFAWQQIGGVLTREGFSGRVPHDASHGPGRWTGHQASLPGERAPKRGYVVTANEYPDHELATYGAYAVPAWRHQRIHQVLSSQDSFTPADMNALQNDRVEVQAIDVLPTLLADLSPSDPGAQRALALLTDWDHHMGVDSAAAAVWAVFVRELHREMLTPRLGADGAAMYLSVASPSRSLLAGNYGPYLTDREAMVTAALTTADAVLVEALGDDPGNWTWGALHPLKLQHPFARNRKLLAAWNMRELPWGGDGNTVNAANFSWTGDDLRVTGMASLRVVMPLSDLGASTLVHPGGQSGQPKHRHFASHYEAFVAGETLPLWFDEDDVARETVSTLTLTR